MTLDEWECRWVYPDGRPFGTGAWFQATTFNDLEDAANRSQETPRTLLQFRTKHKHHGKCEECGDEFEMQSK